MGKISQQAKNNYSEYTKKYKTIIEEIIVREKSLDTAIKSGKEIQNIELTKIEMADTVLNMASYYVLLNELSTTLLGIKNDNFLNEARKACYRAIIYIESVVTDMIDIPLSELAESQVQLSGLDDRKKI